ncbi:MAG: LysR family transcriptional regulator [Candidatus Micrarchaeia archaeon]|jgi:DNA-binding transcriptional LysR family regulator
MNKLRTFYTIAKYRSFTKAGELLGLTQPAVSLQMKALEEEYCTKLFERIGREVFLTDAGKVLFEHAERILTTLEEADLAIKECKDPFKGKVSFGASMFAGAYIIPPILGRFKEYHPGIVFSVKVRYAKDIFPLILENEVDFGLMGEGERKPDDTSFLTEVILREEMVFVMPRGHKFAEKKSVSMHDIVQENLVLPERFSASRRYIESEFQRNNLSVKPYLEIGNIEVVKKLVEQNFGSSILSWASVREEVAARRICAARITGVSFERDILLVKKREKTFFPATTLFIDFLLDEVTQNKDQFVFTL